MRRFFLFALSLVGAGCGWTSEVQSAPNRPEIPSSWLTPLNTFHEDRTGIASDEISGVVYTAGTEYPEPVVIYALDARTGAKKRIPLGGKFKGTVEVSRLAFHNQTLIIAGHFSGKLSAGDFTAQADFSGSDLFVIRYHVPTGKVTSLQHLDLGGKDQNRCLLTDPEGNAYLAGFSNINKTDKAFVLKLSPAGKILWSNVAQSPQLIASGSYTYKSISESRVEPSSEGASAVFGMTLRPGGGLCLTGWFDRTFTWGNHRAEARTGSDAFVLNLTASGQAERLFTFGGNDWEAGRSVTADEAGNLYVGGWFWGSFGTGMKKFHSAGASDIFLTKISAEGNILWTRTWGGSAHDALFDLRWKHGRLWGCGWFSEEMKLNDSEIRLTATGDKDAFAFQADSEGNVLKATLWGGHSEDKAHALLIDSQKPDAFIIGYHGQEEAGYAFTARWGENVRAAVNHPAPAIEVYPNPAREYLHLTLKGGKPGFCTFTLTDLAGKEVTSVRPYFDEAQERFTWLLPENLASGTYLLTGKGSDFMLPAQKIIVP